MFVCLHEKTNKTNNFKEADEYYKKTISLDSTNADYFAHYGENLISGGKTEEGIQELQQAIKINPKNYIALYNLAKVYFAQKKYKIAKQVLEDMLNITQNDPEILNMLGLCHLKLKEYKEAAGIFENLKNKFPKNHILLCNLAQCYLKLNEFEKAKSAAGAALEIFSDYDEALKILKEIQRQND